MPLQNTLITITRHLINDLDVDTTYSDSRIQEAIVVAGLIVAQEFSFSTEYTFDLINLDIDPDPVSVPDNLAVALFTLKAACIIEMNKYQDAVGNSIRVRDGDTEIDTTTGFRGYKDILDNGPCKTYEKLVKDKTIHQSMGFGGAVMSPIAHVDLTHHSGVGHLFDSLLKGR